MSDPSPVRRDKPSAGNETPGQTAPGMPGWVKLSAIIVAVLVLVAVVAMLVMGGEHGPGRHAAEGQLGQQIELLGSAES